MVCEDGWVGRRHTTQRWPSSTKPRPAASAPFPSASTHHPHHHPHPLGPARSGRRSRHPAAPPRPCSSACCDPGSCRRGRSRREPFAGSRPGPRRAGAAESAEPRGRGGNHWAPTTGFRLTRSIAAAQTHPGGPMEFCPTSRSTSMGRRPTRTAKEHRMRASEDLPESTPPASRICAGIRAPRVGASHGTCDGAPIQSDAPSVRRTCRARRAPEPAPSRHAR